MPSRIVVGEASYDVVEPPSRVMQLMEAAYNNNSYITLTEDTAPFPPQEIYFRVGSIDAVRELRHRSL